MPEQSARPPIETSEIDRLERLFGQIHVRPAHLVLSGSSQEHWWPILDSDRRAEAVLILPRTRGRVLLITKPTYPPNTYRLPTGGVGLQEDVLSAATREVVEETGLSLAVDRVLGIVDWTFRYAGDSRRFASYLCLFPCSSAPVRPSDPNENISAYREPPRSELSTVAAQLRHLPAEWTSWGRQRALPHQLLLELLPE